MVIRKVISVVYEIKRLDKLIYDLMVSAKNLI